MDKTKIDWCDSSWNPITGCRHKCNYCYARGIVNRFNSRKGFRLVEPETYHITAEDGTELIEMNEQAFFYRGDTEEKYRCAYPHGFIPTIHRYRMTEYQGKQKPRNIFAGSMADIFGEWVPNRWIREVFNSCETAPQHNYLFLTKNPKRYIELAQYGELPCKDNMWYGSTATTPHDEYAWFDRIAGYHWFLSVEPIHDDFGEMNKDSVKPEWIIVGAETGNSKGKVIPKREWIENIVNQCRKWNIPVFMKSSLADIWGEELIQEFPKELCIKA